MREDGWKDGLEVKDRIGLKWIEVDVVQSGMGREGTSEDEREAHFEHFEVWTTHLDESVAPRRGLRYSGSSIVSFLFLYFSFLSFFRFDKQSSGWRTTPDALHSQRAGIA